MRPSTHQQLRRVAAGVPSTELYLGFVGILKLTSIPFPESDFVCTKVCLLNRIAAVELLKDHQSTFTFQKHFDDIQVPLLNGIQVRLRKLVIHINVILRQDNFHYINIAVLMRAKEGIGWNPKFHGS